MVQRRCTALLAAIVLSVARRASCQGSSSASSLTYLNTTAGVALLVSATHAAPYPSLAMHFVTQARVQGQQKPPLVTLP